MTSSSDKQPSWQPISDLTISAGFIAPASIQTNLSDRDFQRLSKAATKILENPLEVRQLADKVYKLMQADLRIQRDRSGNCRGWR